MTQIKEETGVSKSVVIATVVAVGAVVKNGFHCIYPGSFSLPRLGVMARHFFRSRANSAQVLIGSPR